MSKDTIYREDAIKAIEELRKEPHWLHDGDDYRVCGLSEAEDAIERLPSVDRPQEWIPCSERLPDYMVAVLTWDGMVYAVEKRIPYITDEDGEHIMSEWWVSDDFDEENTEYYPNLRDGAAIAWMPLPEPWKGADDE